jgi:hypothetical protein
MAIRLKACMIIHGADLGWSKPFLRTPRKGIVLSAANAQPTHISELSGFAAKVGNDLLFA